MASGGISPNGWTSEFTLLVVMMGLYQLGGETSKEHPESQILANSTRDTSKLAYVADVYQLTKELAASL
jgi:hypothetical protein